MDNRGGAISNHSSSSKLLNSASDVHTNEVICNPSKVHPCNPVRALMLLLFLVHLQVIKLMSIGGYSINDQNSPESNQKDLDRERYGDPLHHNFVTVIPVEYPRQKFPSYTNQNFSSQEDIRTYPMPLADKDHSEMSSIASVSTQSSHMMNRGMSGAAADKPSPPRAPNGQCMVSCKIQLTYQITKAISFRYNRLCFSEQRHLRLCGC